VGDVADQTAAVTPEHFDALFDSFHTTAVRLETLPAYAVADYEGERLTAFLEGRPLPLRTIATDPWLARMAATTLAGKQWSRVRVLDEPLTDYEHFELAVYLESQAVGETIHVLPRSALATDGPDFWLFDGATPSPRAVLMDYGPDGSWLGARLVDDPAVIMMCRARLAQALGAARPLNEFLAVPHG
jgi:hypothetical protein